jgi:AraC-like DNA-binding protein
MSTAEGFAHNPLTLLHIAAELRRRGVAPLDLFRRAGVPPSTLFDENGWVPRELCFELGDAAATMSGDTYFASSIGAAFTLSELGVWGDLILGATTIREACAAAGDNIGLLHQGTFVRLVPFSRHAELRFGFDGALRANPRQHIIGTLVVLRKIALLADMPEAVGVQFSMPYARDAGRLEETHGPRLEFGRDSNAIIIDRDILDMPLGGARAGRVSSRLESVETPEAFGTLLRELLPYGGASIEAFAAKEHVSTRTVQRKLEAWGFTFREILDDLRRTEAIQYVKSGKHSVLEIALMLGYSDHAHFTRAFRRWTGMPPRDYARALRAAAA